jgi:Arc/MetJ-type ribon-helix-helix transcriptional regulator
MTAPETENKDNRIAVRLPYAMVKEVDRLVNEFPIYGNRQQFIESAVRERLLRARVEESALRTVKQ